MPTFHRSVARRYELEVPLRYRRSGDPSWRSGRTVNASRTGVLFQTSGEPVDAGTQMELQLELLGESRQATVHCTGAVVRCERPSLELVRIAVTIDGYHFGDDDVPSALVTPRA
jgi:hypothetical protein